MKFLLTCLISLCFIKSLDAQIVSPLQLNKYQKVTSFDQLSDYIHLLDKKSDLLTTEIIGMSVQRRNIYALKFSENEFGKDKSKIKVLIFAQQHGNEQSGKEGALLLASSLLKPENRYLFSKIDLAIIPQMNPDGSEQNKRRNANGTDLNRNHLLLTEPENQALHHFFTKYLFEITLDVHEYAPYGEEWVKYGYRKNSDITIGVNTNPNIPSRIREYSHSEMLPFILKYLSDRNFSSFEYCPGGPPGVEYFRQSTFDVNDGRQSLGIQNTYSFIQEGLNGTDTFLENIKHRSEGQMIGMRGLLDYVYNHKKELYKDIKAERASLISGRSNKLVSIQSEHLKIGQTLKLPLFSYSTQNDTIAVVEDFKSIVKSLYDVPKPIGYLIDKNDLQLVEWIKRHELVVFPWNKLKSCKIEQYKTDRVDSIDFEGDIIISPMVSKSEYKGQKPILDFIFIPTAQLKGNMIVLALEPKSMLGLVTYTEFKYLLNAGNNYPVLRVVKK